MYINGKYREKQFQKGEDTLTQFWSEKFKLKQK